MQRACFCSGLCLSRIAFAAGFALASAFAFAAGFEAFGSAFAEAIVVFLPAPRSSLEFELSDRRLLMVHNIELHLEDEAGFIAHSSRDLARL